MTIRSMPSNKNWDDNYDKIFGKKEEPDTKPEDEDEEVNQDAENNDG